MSGFDSAANTISRKSAMSRETRGRSPTSYGSTLQCRSCHHDALIRHVYLDGRWHNPTFARESRYSDFGPSTYEDDITIFARILDYARSFLIQVNGHLKARTPNSTFSLGGCTRSGPPSKDIEMIVSTPSPTLRSPAGTTPGSSYRSRSSRYASSRFTSSISPRVFARSQPSAAQSSPTLVDTSNRKAYSASVASSQTPSRSTADAATQYSPPKPADAPVQKGAQTSLRRNTSPMIANEQAKPPPEPALPPKRHDQSAATSTSTTEQSTISVAAGPPTSSSSSASSSSPSTSKASVRSATGLTRSSGDVSLCSPTKRQRTLRRPPRILPADYSNCPAQDLATIISSMLVELVRINDKIPLKSNNLTRFHSRAPPTISIADYLARLTTHATLSPPILLSMVYYIDRLCTLYDAFTISSLTVHRFLITAATVAAKGLSDSFWTNNTYARVGGVTMKELALLELEFLWRVEWKIVPKPEILEDYYRSLIARSTDFKIEGSSESSNSSSSSRSSSSGRGSESGRSCKSKSSSGRKRSRKSKGKEKETIANVDVEKGASSDEQMGSSSDNGSGKDIVMQDNQ